jgi:hypothetical protein
MTTDMPGSAGFGEVVICQNRVSMQAHKELFLFEDIRYVICGENFIDSMHSLAEKGPDRIHIAVDWENLLKTAFWTDSAPPMFEVLALLKRSGAAEGELVPFKKSDIADLFPWLYYGGKFDILRRICNSAKAKAEQKINRKSVRIYCHLVSEESMRIIASSL